MWNTDRKAVIIKIIDALEVVAVEAEADPEPASYDILGSGDYDEAQILTFIRVWLGLESEMITNEQMIDLFGLDVHPGTGIFGWMMTDLGVLVANGDVTVDEFMLALQYVLEHAWMTQNPSQAGVSLQAT